MSGAGDQSHTTEQRNDVWAEFVSTFGAQLHKAVADTRANTNFTFTPTRAVASVFAMFLGADGASEDELNQILNVNENEGIILKGFCEHFNTKLNEDQNNNKAGQTEGSGARFVSSQRLFHSSGDCIQSKYIDMLSKSLDCDVRQLDFLATAQAFRKIVQYIENEGNQMPISQSNKLKELLKLDALSRLVFMSSMRFSGCLDMQLGYAEQATYFQVNSTTRVATIMLCAEMEMKYAVFPQMDARGVAIPYEGGRFSLWLFLPKGKEGLAQVEHNLRHYRSGKEIAATFGTNKRKLHFRMPYFKFHGSVDMAEALKLLGASSVFDVSSANFGKLEETSEEAHVSALAQHAQLEIHSHEKALQQPVMNPKSKQDPNSMDFHVEHPFCFMIYDEILETVAVSGRIVNPLEE